MAFPAFARLLKIVLFLTVAVAPCFGAFIAYSTPPGATTGGGPVAATASFTTSLDTIQIQVTNNQANPNSVGQNISGLAFIISSGQTSGTLSSSLGLLRTVNAGGTYTDGALAATGWALEDNIGGGLRLNVLGTAVGPAHLIIGPPDGSNLYSNAGGSIANNGPHNPFLAGTVTFTLNVPGVTAASTITGVTFLFGTTLGAENSTVGGNPLDLVPEPMTISLVSAGLLALGLARRRWRK